MWTLLEPVGRRVNIEAIANKRLAIGECVAQKSLAALLVVAGLQAGGTEARSSGRCGR